MKKILAIMMTLAGLLPAASVAAKTKIIYKQKNNPANYVKVVDFKEGKALNLNQPYNFTEDQMADLLRSLRYSKRALFSDQVKSRRVFEEEYIEKYTPLLIKAFKEATPEDMVYMSVAQKRPWYIVRDDRLTQAAMWVTGQELHIRFDKTEAKLGGDYQANTPEGQKMRMDATGLRISMEPQPGQKFAFDSSSEIILDLNSNWEAIVTQIEAEEERLRMEAEIEKARGSKKKQLKAEAEAKTAPATAPAPAAPVSAVDQKDAEERLTELKKLKDKGLISQQDYDKKKEEILKGM